MGRRHLRGGVMSASVTNRPATEQVTRWRTMRLAVGKIVLAGIVCCGLVAAAAYTPRVAAQSSASRATSAGAAPAASAQANEKRELLQADTALERALAKGDKIATDQLLDADFAWTDSTGKTLTKAQVLQAIEAGKAPETIHVDNAP